MRQYGIVRGWVVVGIGVIAMAWACYLVFGPTDTYDAIWGPYPAMNDAHQCLRRGDFNRALAFANRAVRCRPDVQSTYRCRAMVLEARHDFGESLRDYTKVISLGDNRALIDRGRVLEKMGEHKRAAAEYCEVLRSDLTESRRSSYAAQYCLAPRHGAVGV